MDDAQFSMATDKNNGNPSLFLCGNIREHQEEGTEDLYNGYNTYRIDLVDLDQVVSQKVQKGEVVQSPERKSAPPERSLTKSKTIKLWKGEVMKEFQNPIHTLQFLLPSFFYHVTDERGNLKLPAHYLLPFDF
jgi:hypothetical protein